MKKVISLAVSVAIALSMSVCPVFAADMHITKRSITANGWLDNFEESLVATDGSGYAAKGAGYTNGYGLLANASTSWGNYYTIAPDPLGKNGNSLMFYFRQFSKAYQTSGTWASNNPILSTSAWQQKQPGYGMVLGGTPNAAIPGVVSFDMYLPKAFDKTEDNFTGIDLRLVHGQGSTSETVSRLQFRENTVTWEGIKTSDSVTTNSFELPIGRWFNIKLIVDNFDSNAQIGATADLWIDGNKMFANAVLTGSKVSLIDSNNRNVSEVTETDVNLFYMVRYGGIGGIEWEMVTSEANSGKTDIDTKCYIDNLAVRPVDQTEIMGTRLEKGGLGSTVVSKLEGAGNYTYKVSAINAINAAQDLTKNLRVFAKVLKDDKLYSIAVSNSIPMNGNRAEGHANVTFSLPDLSDGEYTLYIYIWDCDSLQPLHCVDVVTE